MRILAALTYYQPHVSGLTIYVQRLSEALVDRGHEVTVLTSQYDPRLPRWEYRKGVQIVRVPVAFRLSKGVIMPTFGFEATRQVRDHDVLSLHLPQFDAAGIAARGHLWKKPTILTYHCDVLLPGGLVNWAANRAVVMANHLAVKFADRIVAYTRDYALHSPFLGQYLDKIEVIRPPVTTPLVAEGGLDTFLDRFTDGAGPFIGMAARLATEKGVEYLLKALPMILERYPQAQVLFAGQYQQVLGESDYARRIEPMIQRVEHHWHFLGVLDPEEMSAFYRTCDVTVLPSLNSTESFGLVQIESMMNGTPVVASNLPGVRRPVQTTGMGEIAPLGDAEALAASILRILERPDRYTVPAETITPIFNPDKIAQAYEGLFLDLMREKGRSG